MYYPKNISGKLLLFKFEVILKKQRELDDVSWHIIVSYMLIIWGVYTIQSTDNKTLAEVDFQQPFFTLSKNKELLN